MKDRASRIKSHSQALSGTLSVPYHSNSPVSKVASGISARKESAAWFACFMLETEAGSTERLRNGNVDRVELMVACHLFGKCAPAQVLKYNEMTYQV